MSSASTSTLTSFPPTVFHHPARTVQPSTPPHHVPGTYWSPSKTYKNPWPSHRSPVNLSTLANTFHDPGHAPHPDDADPDEGVHPVEQHEETDWDKGKGKVKGVWMGHASFYLGFPRSGKGGSEVGVLFDPVWEARCSPSSWVGPVRDIDPPVGVSDLPVSKDQQSQSSKSSGSSCLPCFGRNKKKQEPQASSSDVVTFPKPVHVVLISHDHYDHLSVATIQDLWKYHSATIHFVVPLGIKAWFGTLSPPIPAERVTECDWWDEVSLTLPSDEEGGEPMVIRAACTPSQHSSGRGPGSQGSTLWCSWVVGLEADSEAKKSVADELAVKDTTITTSWAEDPTDKYAAVWKAMRYKVFFGGDTGYRLYGTDPSDPSSGCPAFAQIASLYAPFSLLLLPISPGSSLPYITSFLPYPLSQIPIPAPNLGIMTSHVHLTPADAIELFSVLGGGRGVGIHWGTWGGEQLAKRTRRWLWGEMRKNGVKKTWEEGKGLAKEGGGAFELWRVGEVVVLEEETGGVVQEAGDGKGAEGVQGKEGTEGVLAGGKGEGDEE